MMISKTMNQRLNKQVVNEFHAAHSYLAMSCKLEGMGLKVLAGWFHKHSEEERQHAMKLIGYVQETGGEVVLDGIPKPQGDYASVEQIVKSALDHELLVTRQINELVALADEEHDYASRSFLNWFVDEQVEEVSVVSELLQLVRMAGEQNMLHVEARVARMAGPAS